MNKRVAKAISEFFNELDRTYPEKSTEWLIAITSDMLEIGEDDVVEALAIEHASEQSERERNPT